MGVFQEHGSVFGRIAFAGYNRHSPSLEISASPIKQNVGGRSSVGNTLGSPPLPPMNSVILIIQMGTFFLTPGQET